jgi:hypothetical protein
VIALSLRHSAQVLTAGLGSHLWQSTVLAAGALILSKTLSRAPAKVRFSILLFASAKFLVPFDLLVVLG